MPEAASPPPMVRRTRRPAPAVLIVGFLFVAMIGLGTTFCQLGGFSESEYCSQYHLPGFALNVTSTSAF